MATETDKPTGSWPPKRCEMPDIQNLFPWNILNYMLNRTFRGAGPKDSQASSLLVGFIRLVDQSVQEYENARAALNEFVSTPNNVITPLFKASGHLETCIGAIWRAINFARRMRNDKNSPSIPRRIPVLSKTVKKPIKNIRHAIQHAEEKIMDNRIVEGDAIFLVVKSDALEIAGTEVTYTDLSNWIKELHCLASSLADYHEPG